MQTAGAQPATAMTSGDAAIHAEFIAFLRGRGYAPSTIRVHEQRLHYFIKRVARSGRRLGDLRQDELRALLSRMHPAEKVLSRAFIRVWIRFRNPPRREKQRPWQRWVDEFLDFRANHQAIAQCSLAKESRAVRRYLTRQFGAKPCSWSEVRVQDIWRYSDESSRDYKAAVANQRLGYLRAFLRFMHLRGQCPIALANAVSFRATFGFESRTPQILSDEQRTAFLCAFDRSQTEGARDYAMALCMVDLGLRVGEVVLLKLGDISWIEGCLNVPGIKSHGPRTVPLVPRLREALRDYVDHFRPQTDSDRLFVRHPRFRGGSAGCQCRLARHALCLPSMRFPGRMERCASSSAHIRDPPVCCRRPREGDRRPTRASRPRFNAPLHPHRHQWAAPTCPAMADMNRCLKVATLARRYLEHRRRLGYSLHASDGRLRQFGEYCDRVAPRQPITTARAVEWASQTAAGSAARARRLAMVRSLALYCATLDPRTEVPPPHLLGNAAPRTRPHIFTDAEIARIMRRAQRLSDAYSPLRPHTYETLIGLLACTGMRPCEALRLKVKDFDPVNGTIRVPALKTSPERVLPLHPTAVTAIDRYLAQRRRLCPMGDHLFVGPIGRPLSHTSYNLTMQRLLRGVQSNGARRMVRPYDLRHTFATKLITKWSKQDQPVGHRLLLLTRYLGHAQFTHTWWYVSGQRSALRAAALQFERYIQIQEDDDL
jgi:integrase/recombinase XerC